MTRTHRTPVLDTATAMRLAVLASVDPRTLAKVAAGEPVRGLAFYRARAVLEAAGFRVPEQPVAQKKGGAA